MSIDVSDVLNVLSVDMLYEGLHRIKTPRNLILTPEAEKKLASIAGHMLGLCHAGQTELANTMMENFNGCLHRLTFGDDQTQFDFPELEDYCRVPSRKVILADDRCLHSFSFIVLEPIDPSLFDPEKKVHMESIFDVRLTEQPWFTAASCKRDIYYKKSFNGGLIYHGPGSGETFTVLVGRTEKTFWSLHT